MRTATMSDLQWKIEDGELKILIDFHGHKGWGLGSPEQAAAVVQSAILAIQEKCAQVANAAALKWEGEHGRSVAYGIAAGIRQLSMTSEDAAFPIPLAVSKSLPASSGARPAGGHLSDCPVNNEPAYTAGHCDCRARMMQEKCAQVVEAFGGEDDLYERSIASAIRALKMEAGQ